MSEAIEILVFGASISALYVLIAIGFTLIFSIGGIANLTHGALLMLGAYIVFLLVGRGIVPLIGVLVAVGLVAVFAIGVYRFSVRPVEDEPLTALMVTLLLAFLMEEFIGIFITREPRSLPALVAGNVDILGVTLPYNRVIAFVVSWIAVFGVWYFVTRTPTGQAVLAASIDEKGAASVGINVSHINFVVWGIAGGLAALAGYFFGSFTSLSPHMGFDPLLTAFVIVVIGGLGSISGSVAAAYLIGFLETAAVFLIDPGAQGLFSFGILILIMLTRPEGLFGKRELDFD